MLTELEKELCALIRLGKKTGNMELRNEAKKALTRRMEDDGTPGLFDYLYEVEVRPAYLRAKHIAKELERKLLWKEKYRDQTLRVVRFSKIHTEVRRRSPKTRTHRNYNARKKHLCRRAYDVTDRRKI